VRLTEGQRRRRRSAAYDVGMSTLPHARPGTLAEALALPEDARVEFVGGQIVQKAAPSAEHGHAQRALSTELGFRFSRRSGGRFPGGWWILVEVDVQLGGELFRPDITGWRRETMPALPKGRPVATRPDWICEIVSASNARIDRVEKMRAYHQAGVAHYWLVDPQEETLIVQRHSAAGYVTVLAAARGDTVRPEPFEAAELKVGVLFGDEPDE